MDDAFASLCGLALKELDGLLTHKDAYVLEAATMACVSLLQSNIGMKAVADHPSLVVFQTRDAERDTQPFKYTGVEIELVNCICGESMAETHSKWITNVAVVLLTLFDAKQLANVAAKEVHTILTNSFE